MWLNLVLAALGDAADAAQRRAAGHELRARLGVSTEPSLPSLHRRLLWVFSAFPEDIAAITLSLVCAMANPGMGLGSTYYTADGHQQLRADLQMEQGREPRPGDARQVFCAMLRRPTPHQASALPEAVAWEDLIPWIAREVQWVERTHPPAKRVRRSAIFRTLQGEITLDLDLAQRVLTYVQTAAAIYDRLWATVAERTEARRPQPDDESAEPSFWDDDLVAARRRAIRAAYAAGCFDAQFERPSASLDGHEAGSLFYPYSGSARSAGLTGADLLREVHLNRLRKGFPMLIDWVRAVRPNLSTMHSPEALAAAAAWHRKQPTRRELGAAAGTLLAEVPGVGTWRELAPEDLAAESDAMKHCVGRTPVYAQGMRGGRTRILSLRNAEGRPLFTIELQKKMGRPPLLRPDRSVAYPAVPTRWVLTQWKGPRDRLPGLRVVDTRQLPSGSPASLAAWVLETPTRLVRTDLPIVRTAHGVLLGLGLGACETEDLVVVNLADQGLLS